MATAGNGQPREADTDGAGRAVDEQSLVRSGGEQVEVAAACWSEPADEGFETDLALAGLHAGGEQLVGQLGGVGGEEGA